MRRGLEYSYPFVGGFAIFVVCLILFLRAGVSADIRDMFGAALTVESITVGFLINASCTLLTIQESNWIIRRARKVGAYRLLVDYLISGAVWNFLAAVSSAAAYLLQLQKSVAWWQITALSAWCGLITVATLTIIRVFQILTVIMRANADPEIE